MFVFVAPSSLGEDLSPTVEMEKSGGSALIRAAESGNINGLKVLINSGVPPNLQLNNGTTALVAAVERGHAPMVFALVNAGADVNLPTNTGVTALMCAAREGNLACVQNLLGAGADVHLLEKCDGISALMMAAAGGKADCLRCLIEAGAAINLQTKVVTESDLRSRIYRLQDIRYALPYPLSALDMAVACGSEACVRILIEAGAEVSASALIRAVEDKHSACVDALVDRVADVDGVVPESLRNTPLMEACQQGVLRNVVTLIGAGADINRQKKTRGVCHTTPLMMAIYHGHVLCVRELVNAGADLDIQNSEGGWSALMVAAREGEIECMQVLIGAGADLNLQTKNGRSTALIIAANNRNGAIFEAVSELALAGADVTIKDNKGKTALCYLCERYDLNRLELFEKQCHPDDYRKNAWEAAFGLLVAEAGTGGVAAIPPPSTATPTSLPTPLDGVPPGASRMLGIEFGRRSAKNDLRCAMALMRNSMTVFTPKKEE